MLIDVKDLMAIAFEVEIKLCDIDSQDIGAYHLALSEMLKAVKEAIYNAE